MKNATETLLWVLKFIEMDFGQYRAGDWMNLSEDLEEVFGWSLLGQELSQNVVPLKDLQKRVRAHLDVFADGPSSSPFPIPGLPDDSHRPFDIPEAHINGLQVRFYEKKKWTFEVTE